MADSEDFFSYKKFLVAELERLADELHAMRAIIDETRRKEIAELRTDIALLKFQTALWGAGLGAAAGIAATLIVRMIK